MTLITMMTIIILMIMFFGAIVWGEKSWETRVRHDLSEDIVKEIVRPP